MARATTTLPRRTGRTLIPPTVTLALWRLRKTWGLLSITGLGILAATVLICAVPLFYQVAASAGLRNALSNDNSNVGIRASERPAFGNGSNPAFIDAASNSQISVSLFLQSLSPSAVSQTTQDIDGIMHDELSQYLSRSAPVSVVATSSLPLSTTDGSAGAGAGKPGAIQPVPGLRLLGPDPGYANTRVTLTSGTLPAETGPTVAPEIAVSKATADALHVQVGSTLTLLVVPQGATQRRPLALHISGIFTAPTATADYLNDGTFAPTNVVIGSSGPNGTPIRQQTYTALAARDSLLEALSTVDLSPRPPSNADGNKPFFPYSQPPTLSFLYQLDTASLTESNAGALTDHLRSMQGRLFNYHGTYAQGIFMVNSPALNVLSNYGSRLAAVQVPIAFLLLQVIGLVLFFMSLMAEFLIDRQSDAIALLRSRGARRGHIFGALSLQTFGLGLLALIAGPLVAIPAVYLFAQRTLSASDQGALNVLGGSPIRIALDLRWFAIVAVVGMVGAMIVSIYRIAGRNVLALRREAARTTNKPLWQRLNLDLIFAVIALTGYVGYSITVQRVDPRIRTVLSPLALIAPIFLLIAMTLLFLRVLPLLLRLGARLASRGRAAMPMVALAQISRSPRQSIRMTLLLALSTAFTIFLLVLTASQSQRALDVAAYQVGGDFSGDLPSALVQKATFADIKARYAAVPGVTSATLGHVGTFSQGNGLNAQVNLLAVDADTYAGTAIWTSDESSQPLGDLTSLIAAKRATAASDALVPAVVDDAAAATLRLAPGQRFSLTLPGGDHVDINFIAVAVVHHIPTFYDSPEAQAFGGPSGMLVDYATYSAVYAKATSDTAPTADSIWLRSRDDATSLTSVRASLGTGDLALNGLQDRRQIIKNAGTDALQIDLLGTVGLGAATALLLALVGVWVGSWLTARGRVVNFAVLRALGSTPRQILAVLLWEQVIVYVAALAIGILLGALLSVAVLPTLVLTSLISGTNNGFNDVPPIRAIVPYPALGIGLGMLVLVCIIALAITLGAVSRLSLGRTLRLNED